MKFLCNISSGSQCGGRREEEKKMIISYGPEVERVEVCELFTCLSPKFSVNMLS